MTAVKAKDHYSYEELLSCARGEMFGPGNAQLPSPPMLLFDRIIKITDEGGLHGKGRGRALGCGEVKFAGEVTPDIKKVTYKIEMKRVINRRLVMGIGDGVLEADGKPIYTAEDLRVGLYQRP